MLHCACLHPGLSGRRILASRPRCYGVGLHVVHPRGLPMAIHAPLLHQGRDRFGDPICPLCHNSIPPGVSVLRRLDQMVHLACGERARTNGKYAELRPLAEASVLAGMLPSDPRIPASIVKERRDAVCSLCRKPLGGESVFQIGGEQAVLLHALCFSAWVDVVFTERADPGTFH